MTDLQLLIGHGYDVHRFAASVEKDKPLVLGACRIDEPFSLEAHSDGDIVLHALCDAILGAAGLGDIGEHFPDTAEEFAGIASTDLLARVLEQIGKDKLALVNIDITVIAQVPKLSPYRALMREKIAQLTSLAVRRVNLKATTTERLGYIGREEGMACHCVVLLQSNV